jgi:hypothetical protein
MADDKHSERSAETQQYEAILAMRIVWILHQQGTIVVEDGLSLLERDAVPPLVLGILLGVPLEADVGHRFRIVTTT